MRFLASIDARYRGRFRVWSDIATPLVTDLEQQFQALRSDFHIFLDLVFKLMDFNTNWELRRNSNLKLGQTNSKAQSLL